MLATLKENKQLYRRLRLGLIALGCLFLVWGSYEIWATFYSDTTVKLRMSTGRTVTRRYQIAEQLRDTVSASGLRLDLMSTAGSEKALELVDKGELDLAIVNSGILGAGKSNVRELAAFQVEPVHFLVRSELASQPGLMRDILKGKRINLGEPGSSDYALAQEILAFVNVKPGDGDRPGDFHAMSLGQNQLMQLSQEILHEQGEQRLKLISDLPDAVLLISSMPSKVAQSLIEAADYRIVPLPFVRAFVSNTARDDGELNTNIDHSYLEQTVIPSWSYLGTKPTPTQDIETIGLRLILVANKNVPTSVIYRLMSGVFEGEFARRTHPLNPTEKASPYDVHLGALAYNNRNKPYLVNEFIETGKKIFSAFGLFSAGALSFFALLRTSKSKSAGDYLNEIRQVDLIARGVVSDSQAPRERTALIRYLDDRLAKLKSELIHDCCKKKFKNEMMLLNILTILVDTRKQVAQLLPHDSAPEAQADPKQATLAFQGRLKKAG